MRDPGFDPRGIMVIIGVGVIVKSHALGEALGERSQQHAGVEPQPEPPFLVLGDRVPPVAPQARRLVATG